MKPIIKYTGGKSREIPIIQPFFPKFENYVEPFVGGGAVFFHLESENAAINDLNPYLVDFYKTVANNRNQLIEELQSLSNDSDTYYAVRDMFNGKIEHNYLQATLYAYLNRTAFSGLTRYNSKGEMNVPFGNYKTYHPWDFFTDNAVDLLQKTTITNDSFEKLFERYNDPKYFFYCDPPYLSPFKEYLPFEKFDEDKHRLLAELFKTTKSKVMINISDLGIIRELYEGYIIHEYDKTYAFNVKERERENNNVKHLIITNY